MKDLHPSVKKKLDALMEEVGRFGDPMGVFISYVARDGDHAVAWVASGMSSDDASEFKRQLEAYEDSVRSHYSGPPAAHTRRERMNG